MHLTVEYPTRWRISLQLQAVRSSPKPDPLAKCTNEIDLNRRWFPTDGSQSACS